MLLTPADQHEQLREVKQHYIHANKQKTPKKITCHVYRRRWYCTKKCPTTVVIHASMIFFLRSSVNIQIMENHVVHFAVFRMYSSVRTTTNTVTVTENVHTQKILLLSLVLYYNH